MDIVEVEELILKLSKVVSTESHSTIDNRTRKQSDEEATMLENNHVSNSKCSDMSNNNIALHSSSSSDNIALPSDTTMLNVMEEKSQEMKTRILIVESKLSRLEMEMEKYKEETFSKRTM